MLLGVNNRGSRSLVPTIEISVRISLGEGFRRLTKNNGIDATGITLFSLRTNTTKNFHSFTLI